MRRSLLVVLFVAAIGLIEYVAGLLFPPHSWLRKLFVNIAWVLVTGLALRLYVRYGPDLGSSRLSITDVSATSESENEKEITRTCPG
jgi:hypothetical protein